jgi:cell division septation protein DedD
VGEPKKVRTVTIRPNAVDANMAPPSLAPPTTAAAPPAPRTAPSQQSIPAQQRVPAQQRAPVQQRAPAPAAQSGAPPANAPLALNDDSVLTLPRSLNEPPPAPQPQQAPARRPAPAPKANTAPPPERQALAQAGAPKTGGFLVQVSSQRKESEAQAALRGLQAKYPNVLGGQPSTIRRAELGERGVFYRAMVGPFASRDQATQLCASLKAAGGDCIVQGN